ncbi:putative RNA methyltransferase At5g51130 [Phytophthora citrophthora]|uniref:RNA methyltransferase n=1 Tax=Phytophthora citrophthora TaxID=4793 RepID=A0AAD9GSZ8_9STRA|nr:putative RNA methyltransferase At5g51130 [Phytophthora citrophthora]
MIFLMTKRTVPDGDGAAPSTAKPAKNRKQSKKPQKQQRVGNFRSYYTYRLGQKHQGELGDDPRLAALDKTWFEGKRGLDIGCNSGEFTITIAKKLEPSYLLGVDVDPQLISRARGQLKDILRQEQLEKAFNEIKPVKSTAKSEVGAAESPADSSAKKKDEDASKETEEGDAFANDMPLSFKLWKPSIQAQTAVPRAIGKASVGSKFPLNVIFKREDVVSDAHAGKNYDFITCFSVTKWIHLFHGDEGIKKVFTKIFELLAPGGRLILEPQPWKSYHKRKFTSEVTAANYPKIQLRPKDFPKHLTESVGFRTCELLEICQTSSKGFRRPVYVAQKAD